MHSTPATPVPATDWFPKRSIGMLPADAARRWGDKEAITCDGQRFSYRAFSQQVDRMARALIGCGIAPGEHVALWIGNRPEFLFLFYAIVKAGAVAVPMNTRYRTLDLRGELRKSDCVALLMAPQAGPVDCAAIAREVLGAVGGTSEAGALQAAELPLLRCLVLTAPGDVPGAMHWQRFLARAEGVSDEQLAARAAGTDLDGPAFICHTSGTTGSPKGVVLGHRNIRLGTERAAVMGITHADVQLNYLPLFHSYGLGFVALHCLLTGARQVLMEKFDAAEAVRLIAAEGVTTLHGFDTHFRELVAAKRAQPDADLRSLRVAVLAAGPDGVAEAARTTARELCPTLSAYGMTETGTAIALTFLDGTAEQRTLASGHPLPGVELRVIDPLTGADVPQGATGEILVRYYGLMLGYYRQPEATREAIDHEGWLHTGDMGCLRPDGHLRFLGRYKDMLKVGGENVAPAEIEQLLLEMPGVAEAAVVGCPDPRLQEVPAAFLVARDGATLGLQEVDAFCRGKIASYKLPRRVVVVDELPRSGAGKVLKQALRARLQD